MEGASTPPLGAVDLPIIEDGSAISCLIAPTRTSVDSIDIARVIGREEVDLRLRPFDRVLERAR